MSSQKRGLDGNQRLPGFGDGPFVREDVHLRLRHLVAPHVDSYDYFLEEGLAKAVADLPQVDHTLGDDFHYSLKVERVEISSPTKREDLCDESKLTPRECRERHMTYAGSAVATVAVTLYTSNSRKSGNADDEDDDDDDDEDMDDDVPKVADRFSLKVKLGDLPIMVQSSSCHLSGLSHQELMDLKEEANECGGFFILNGIERVVRLLQVPRRNQAMALERSSFKNRGRNYTDKGVTMRCVRPDQTSVTITLHYLSDGGATLKFVLNKQEFLLPVVLVAKALIPLSDKEFFDRVLAGDGANTFLTTRLELMLRDAAKHRLLTQEHVLAYFGSLFRAFLPLDNRTRCVVCCAVLCCVLFAVSCVLCAV